MKRLFLAGTALLALAASGSDPREILPIAVGDAGRDEILGGGGVFELTNALRARPQIARLRWGCAGVEAVAVDGTGRPPRWSDARVLAKNI